MTDTRDVFVPDLGDGVSEARIVRWLVEVGDRVGRGDGIVELDTAGGVVAVPAPLAGTILGRLSEPGATLRVGGPLCRIEVVDDAGPSPATDAGSEAQNRPDDRADVAPARGGGLPASASAAEQVEFLSGIYGEVKESGPAGGGLDERRRRRRRRSSTAISTDAPTTSGPAGVGGSTDRRPAPRPSTRSLADALGVELVTLAPGPSGSSGSTEEPRAAGETTTQRSVTRRPAAAPDGLPASHPARPAGAQHPTAGEDRAPDAQRSSGRLPHAGCARDVDLTALCALRDDLVGRAAADGTDAPITAFTLVCRAVILALREFPMLNARSVVDPAGGAPLDQVNLGVAVHTDRGSLVPIIKDAHLMSTWALATELDRLAHRCRAGSVTPADVTGGTFTVYDYGTLGNDDGDPLAAVADGAVLGVGAIRERPWAVEGRASVRSVATLKLVFDHRTCDGGVAARFVSHLAELCERPSRFLLHI